MKILKKGNYFKAYATVDNENGTIAKVGDHLGSISIKTEKFVGATACLIELTNHLDEYKAKEMREQINKVKNSKQFVNENKNTFFNTENDDYLTSRYKENDLKIRELKPQKGMWVNFNNEYGDVWHEIEKVYEPDDYYASVYVYNRVDSKSNKSKVSSEYYHKVRKVSETLPEDARVIMSKEGTKSPRRGNF